MGTLCLINKVGARKSTMFCVQSFCEPVAEGYCPLKEEITVHF